MVIHSIMAEPIANLSEKLDVAHLEAIPPNVDDVKSKIDGYDSYGLVKSTFDDLSIPKTLWTFRRIILISLAVYTGYVCEGFEVSSNQFWSNKYNQPGSVCKAWMVRG